MGHEQQLPHTANVARTPSLQGLSSPMQLVKALVWFWINDETLVLASILSVCRINKVGTCQVMEQVMIMVVMVMTTR
jgi:hypothetical protein